MNEAIRLYWGRFGRVSVLNVASDFVTHAHVEAHLIIWLEGTAGEMTIGRETVRLGPGTAAGINSFQPHSHALSHDGRHGLFLAFYIDPDWARSRRELAAGAPLFAQPAISLDPWLHQAAANLQKGLRVFLREEAPLEGVARRLEPAPPRTSGAGEVSMILLLGQGREVEVKLEGRYKVSPQIAGAIKAVPGVVQVEAL